jgi:hypothetical protein
MVHGGGHHHHHDGGGGGWSASGDRSGGGHRRRAQHQGGRPYYQDNIVILNENTGYSATPWYQERSSYYYDRQREQECRHCCGRCCRGMCLAVGCFALASAIERRIEHSSGAMPRETDTDLRNRTVSDMSSYDPPPKCDPVCPWSFFSIILMVVLLVSSSVTETWTLNPGETRRVNVRGWFTRELRVASQTPQSVNIYSIADNCPSLTGPPLLLSATSNIKLAPDDYQYDYVYLNKGSMIDINVTQKYGSTNVMILKGYDSLQDVDEEDDDESFTKRAILARFAGEGTTVRVQYAVVSSDTYVLLYDNASTEKGRFVVSYAVNGTTYDLSGRAPVSSSSPLECDLPLGTKANACILIQALGEGSTESKEAKTIYLSSEKRWSTILIASTIPILLGLLLKCRSFLGGSSPLDAQADTYESIPPVLPTSTVPSAPAQVDTDDYASIPIVAGADVVPLAVPVEPPK